jgi:release factor glutamine methyltransferase
LLAHVLGVPRSSLALASAPDDTARAAYDAAVERRATREPLQHIVGTAAFRHIVVAVGPGVFIPRPETELLVDAVLPALRQATNAVAVDLCSGSGAVALAVADEVPGARVVAVEGNRDAAEWLQRNAAGSRVELVVADVTAAGLLPQLRGCVDAVVCNPPYVPTSTEVAAEVAHDPSRAVFAGTAGLDVIPHALARAAELLRAGGVLALEHDESHESAVPELLHADGQWCDIADHRDLAGRPRYVTAVRA